MLSVPYLTSDFPYYRKIHEELGFGSLIEPLDITVIANAIATAKTSAKPDPKRAFQVLKKHFKWNSEKRDLLALYERILT